MLDTPIKSDLFQGKLIRLVAMPTEEFAKANTQWSRDSEYQRLLDTDYAQLWSSKMIQKWYEEDLGKERLDEYFFHIQRTDQEQLIGFIGLFEVRWSHAEAWVGIGIGDRKSWDKGFGTDAMKVLLRYAFTELNLFRVSLGVFSYNPRAIRSYEKAGFKIEGVERELLHRDGRRSDGLFMGVLRDEWKRSQI